jgi:hypothetical protein
MANLNVTPGSGATVAAIADGSSLLHQQVILETNIGGTPTAVVQATPLPVQHGNGTQYMPSGDNVARPIFVKAGDGTNNSKIALASGALAENAATWTETASVNFALDSGAAAGSQAVPLQVESTAQPNLKTSIWAGANEAAVKGASTAAALTDKSLVTALSPNCPLSKPTAGSPIRVSVLTSIKGSAGVLFGLQAINTTASVRWVQIFDAATTGAVTLGTTKPDYEVQLPANSQVFAVLPDFGVPFTAGIIYAATTGEAGGTPGSAGDVILFPQWV